MKTSDLLQGSPEWHAHRAAHFNASDAPAMLGVSSYKSRAELLREYATGLAGEVDPSTQRRFDEGHRAEALARPLAEEIIGEELYPCVGSEGRYSASFDGLTLLYDVAFEHKSLNDNLRSLFARGCAGADLPEMYQVQMEQQCMVSGAERVLFMASKWEGETLLESGHCWYWPNPELRARIVAGWEQFEADLAEYQVKAAPAPAPVGRAPDALPALRIEVTGMVTASNLAEFRDHAIAVFKGISTDLRTDQDFADAERTVKWCGDIEDRLKAAKEHALSQTQSIDELFRAIDAIGTEARAKRLELDKLVKSRKETVRADIVAAARRSVVDHVAAINATLGEHAIGVPASLMSEIAEAIKGRKTLASITDAAESVAAAAKIDASMQAERIRLCISVLGEHAAGFEQLFPDRVSLCASKTTDDLRNLVAVRIADHKAREQAAAEPVAAKLAPVAAEPEPQKADALEKPAKSKGRATAAPAVARIGLGEINELISPLTVFADGLASLGFESTNNTYPVADLPRIYSALIRVLQSAQIKEVN